MGLKKHIIYIDKSLDEQEETLKEVIFDITFKNPKNVIIQVSYFLEDEKNDS